MFRSFLISKKRSVNAALGVFSCNSFSSLSVSFANLHNSFTNSIDVINPSSNLFFISINLSLKFLNFGSFLCF